MIADGIPCWYVYFLSHVVLFYAILYYFTSLYFISFFLIVVKIISVFYVIPKHNKKNQNLKNLRLITQFELINKTYKNIGWLDTYADIKRLK